MQYATADYVGFIDADDWVELDMYEELYRHAEQYDVVKAKFVREQFSTEIQRTYKNSDNVEYQFQKKGRWYDWQVSFVGNNGEWGSVCTGLYKKSLIIENELWFPEGIAYEDNYWDSILRLYVKNLYIVDKVVYHYRVNLESTVTTRNSSKHFERMEIEVAILKEYIKRGVFELYHDRLEFEFILRYYLNTLYIVFTRFDYIPDIFEEMKNTVLHYFPNFEKNPMIERYPQQYKLLLKLLTLPQIPNETELEKIKVAYLKSIGL